MMYDICLSLYLRLRIVTSCAMASLDDSGPNPHLARRLRVTKEWKSLSTCGQADGRDHSGTCLRKVVQQLQSNE